MKARLFAAILSFPSFCAGSAAAAQPLGLDVSPKGGKATQSVSSHRAARLPSLQAYPIAQKEPGGARRGIVGSWLITGGLSAGVGLMEVTRDHSRQRAPRRVQPMKDVGFQTDRIAAVGLNLRF